MADYGQELQFGLFLTPEGRRAAAHARTGAARRDGRARPRHGPGPPVPGARTSTPGRCWRSSPRAPRRCGSRPTSRTCRCARRSCSPQRRDARPAERRPGRARPGHRRVLGRDRRGGRPAARPGEAVDALAEAIEIIRAVWVAAARCGTRASTTASAGARGPGAGAPGRDLARRVQAADAAGDRPVADGWLPSMGYADPDALAAMNARIDEAAEAAGRVPAAVRRLYNINGAFGTGARLPPGPAATGPNSWPSWPWSDGHEHVHPRQRRRRRPASGSPPRSRPAVRELVDAERSAAIRRSRLPVRSRDAPREDSHAGAGAAAGAEAAGRGRRSSSRRRRTTGRGCTGERLWDEPRGRPTGPSADAEQRGIHRARSGDRPAPRRHPRRLRAELSPAARRRRAGRRGHLSVGAARSLINTMAMRQNNWTLGAYCESYCRIVTGHHTLEDRSVFPHLRRADPRARRRCSTGWRRSTRSSPACSTGSTERSSRVVDRTDGADGMEALAGAATPSTCSPTRCCRTWPTRSASWSNRSPGTASPDARARSWHTKGAPPEGGAPLCDAYAVRSGQCTMTGARSASSSSSRWLTSRLRGRKNAGMRVSATRKAATQ